MGWLRRLGWTGRLGLLGVSGAGVGSFEGGASSHPSTCRRRRRSLGPPYSLLSMRISVGNLVAIIVTLSVLAMLSDTHPLIRTRRDGREPPFLSRTTRQRRLGHRPWRPEQCQDHGRG